MDALPGFQKRVVQITEIDQSIGKKDYSIENGVFTSKFTRHMSLGGKRTVKIQKRAFTVFLVSKAFDKFISVLCAEAKHFKINLFKGTDKKSICWRSIS